jgi:hypothetical protein
VRWWQTVGLFTRVTWWITVLFMIGASCFAIASWAGLTPRWFGSFAANPFQVSLVFFTGSLFLTAAAYLQLLAAVNADREAGDNTVKGACSEPCNLLYSIVQPSRCKGP